jgi:hypothetical protein
VVLEFILMATATMNSNITSEEALQGFIDSMNLNGLTINRKRNSWGRFRQSDQLDELIVVESDSIDNREVFCDKLDESFRKSYRVVSQSCFCEIRNEPVTFIEDSSVFEMDGRMVKIVYTEEPEIFYERIKDDFRST